MSCCVSCRDLMPDSTVERIDCPTLSISRIAVQTPFVHLGRVARLFGEAFHMNSWLS